MEWVTPCLGTSPGLSDNHLPSDPHARLIEEAGDLWAVTQEEDWELGGQLRAVRTLCTKARVPAAHVSKKNCLRVNGSELVLHLYKSPCEDEENPVLECW